MTSNPAKIFIFPLFLAVFVIYFAPMIESVDNEEKDK